MFKSKFLPNEKTKLYKVINKIPDAEQTEKTGFISRKNDKTLKFKTKSFRLRDIDYEKLIWLVDELNKINDRKPLSQSQVIRGLINFAHKNKDLKLTNLKTHIVNAF